MCLLVVSLTSPLCASSLGEPVTSAKRDLRAQLEEFYNLTYIKRLSLEELNWSLLEERRIGDIVVLYGRWEAGDFEGYTYDSHLKTIRLRMSAIVFLPEKISGERGFVCALHTEKHMLEVNHSLFAKLARRYGIPILLYGERSVDWESLGFEGRNELIYNGYFATYLLNKDSPRDIVTGNFALALARTQSYAITLLQRICEERGIRVEKVGFYGGSKEGYAQWFASTVDDRILVSNPVGFQMENFTACIEYMFKQWGDYNPYLLPDPEKKPQPIDFAPIYEFLVNGTGREVDRLLSIAGRINELKAEVYIIGGDVCGYMMHDGKNFPLGCESEFLDSLGKEWRYVRAVNDSEKPFLNRNMLEAVVRLTLNPKEINSWPKIKLVELEEKDGRVRVKARVVGNASEAYLMYGFSRDKVWNSPEVKWTSVRMVRVGERTWASPWLKWPKEFEVAYFVRVASSGSPVRIDSSPVRFYNTLPDKKCSWNPRCVPGLPCVSGFKPGDIISVTYLGTDGAVEGGQYRVAVFYVDFWSSAHGGSRIGARLFVPVGSPKKETGWPLKVLIHGFGGPGLDYWYYPFSDNWKVRMYDAGIAFASHGYVSLIPWMTGAGPSEPFQKYSPLSLEENVKVCIDAFKALRNIPSFMRERGLDSKYGLKLVFDYDRMIFSTNCISSPLMIAFAREYAKGTHPEIRGVRVLIADTFMPSTAYIIHCITPAVVNITGKRAFASWVLWAGVIWCLAEERGWDKSIFFTDEFIKVFSAPTRTPVGIMSLMRSSRLEPINMSRAIDVGWDYYVRVLGLDASGLEIAKRIFKPPLLELLNKSGSFEQILADEFYREYFADSDPFFEENIEPFNPGIPLYVAVSGVEDESGITEEGYRAKCACFPKIETLKAWGWTVYYKYNPRKDVHSWEGEGLAWILENLERELYGEYEQHPFRIPWYVLVLALVAVVLAMYVLFRALKGKGQS